MLIGFLRAPTISSQVTAVRNLNATLGIAVLECDHKLTTQFGKYGETFENGLVELAMQSNIRCGYHARILRCVGRMFLSN